MATTRHQGPKWRTNNYPHKELTGRIITSFYTVYDRLGYGFLESVYRHALAVEFTRAGLRFEQETSLRVWYEGVLVGSFRSDFLLEHRVLVEVKAAKNLTEADTHQLLNYVRCSDKEVGLLLHFGPRPAVKRVVSTAKPKLDADESVRSSASSAPR
jgi:GxxExxY protein